MKIKIVRIDAPVETEVCIRYGNHPDEKTERLLAQLQVLSCELTGYQEGRAYRIQPQDLYYIESVDERAYLYLDRAVYETPLKLYELEARLEGTPFVRVSKSTILNTSKICSVRPLLGGKMEATLANTEKLIVSRHYLPAFRQKFGI